jgi:hypothetical protein
MRRNVLLGLALAALITQNVKAGSAVAVDPAGHIVHSFGGPEKLARERVLEISRYRGWVNAKIIASSDTIGYGAIAVARKGTGSVVGVSIGKRSMAEADTLAMEQCLKRGGTDPKVRWRFRG